jgi:antitoxin VapB
MSEKVAKLFPNGRSQAVRLPVPFRFEGDEVYIRRDPETGEIILSAVPNSWDGFFALRDAGVEDAKDFLLERSDPPPQARALFEPKRSRRKK